MQNFSVWIVIGSAFLAANLPFLNQRFMGVMPARHPSKSLWLRLLELVILYFLIGAMSLALEQHAGQIYPQGWEFYAITGTLFLTFAFPGFVYRYLMHHR